MKTTTEEMRQLLTKMRTLSEVSAGSLVPVRSGKSEDKPPQGVGQTTNRKGEPDADWSLYEHFRYRFDRASSELERRVIVCQARAALRIRTKGPEPWRLERARRTESKEISILLKNGEGVQAAELAATTGWPVSWIETQRERHGREPEKGYERPAWNTLTPAEKRTKAHRMRDEGYTCRKAAKELGCAATTLHRYWPKPEAKAA